ncbi:MAG TPA: cbb3-type cytochrome oxidase assembly protein CcoS [Aliidiomarina sp.]|nr:cbb3-type cytochrome oxidase assembly protein CcoS [Aliidiomarina sp.]
MEYLHIMVPVAVLIVIAIIIILFWAVRTGQFDDLERQGYNILLDDEGPKKKPTEEQPK